MSEAAGAAGTKHGIEHTDGGLPNAPRRLTGWKPDAQDPGDDGTPGSCRELPWPVAAVSSGGEGTGLLSGH